MFALSEELFDEVGWRFALYSPKPAKPRSGCAAVRVFDQTLGELRLYMNGREVQTVYDLVPCGATDGPILIGAQHDDGPFSNRDVGQVRLYRHAPSSAEVEELSKRV